MRHRLFVDGSFDSSMGTNAGAVSFRLFHGGSIHDKTLSTPSIITDSNDCEVYAVHRGIRWASRIIDVGDVVVVITDSDHTKRYFDEIGADELYGIKFEIQVCKSHNHWKKNTCSMHNNTVDIRARNLMRKIRDERLKEAS